MECSVNVQLNVCNKMKSPKATEEKLYILPLSSFLIDSNSSEKFSDIQSSVYLLIGSWSIIQLLIGHPRSSTSSLLLQAPFILLLIVVLSG
ncbi:hypothetical protein AVEN_181408-1 [Araneus ventricosus]|uniref:Uncharacterized protein n=1 Tax=Araneus ventricosus TaxID=182803 RepID=A0A4Y2W6E0_ARAVE|nr:hypothetical protein AVEN_181408-1 [Araneus ventricosus]